MLLKYKTIMKDLNAYLLEGYTNGVQDINQDDTNKCFRSIQLNNVCYKFIKNYEDVDTLVCDSTLNCIPVLIVQNVDLYKKSKLVLYHGRFIDLATLFTSSDLPTGYPTHKINFFIVPYISNTTTNILGSMEYVIQIDYNTEYDVYGIISKEINQILMNHYYSENCCHGYFELVENDDSMYFLPTTVQFQDNTKTLFHRIYQMYNIKMCKVR